MSQQYDAILFDAGGVFLIPDPAVLAPTLAYYGAKLSLGQWTQLSASLQIPYSFFYLALPVGCVVTIVFALLEPLDTRLANELVHAQERAKKVVT